MGFLEPLLQVAGYALPALCFFIALKRKCSVKESFYYALCALIPFWGGVWGTWKYAGTEGGVKKARNKGFQLFFALLIPILLLVGLHSCFSAWSDQSRLHECETQIKVNLKDLWSYSRISSTIDEKRVIIKYKAKNSFGNYVTDSRMCTSFD